MKVPNFVSKLSNQGALIHVLPHIHVEMLGDVEFTPFYRLSTVFVHHLAEGDSRWPFQKK